MKHKKQAERRMRRREARPGGPHQARPGVYIIKTSDSYILNFKF